MRGSRYHGIASHPDARGNGHGAAVLRPGLEAADAEGLPVFLETGTEGNLGFYARYGFAVTDQDAYTKTLLAAVPSIS